MRISYSLPDSPQSAFRIWIEWVALPSLGPLIGVFIFFSVFIFVSEVDIADFIGFFFLIFPGIVLGIAQGFFLRSLFPMYRWTLLTAVTYLLFFPVSWFLMVLPLGFGAGPYGLGKLVATSIGISLLSLPMASVQYLLLKKCFRNAWFWILAVLAGSFLALFLLVWAFEYQWIGQLFDSFAENYIWLLVALVNGAIIGVLPAASTGLCLVYLKPLQSETVAGA